MYFDRVYFKFEFIVFFFYLFSGVDFVLIFFWDEFFGLVVVEFGRKGVFGVGFCFGGFGFMFGWVSCDYYKKKKF